MTNNDGSTYAGEGWPPNSPGAICPATLSGLKNFVGDMSARGVRVLFSHAPYLVDAPPDATWREADVLFRRDIASLGTELVDKREDLFLPRSDFFDTWLHLTETGRRKRTHQLVLALRRYGVGTSPTP
jgi:hypothetical protein